LGHLHLAVKGLQTLCAQRARKDRCSGILGIARSRRSQPLLNCLLGDSVPLAEILVTELR